MEEKKSSDEIEKEYRLLLFLSVVKQLQPSVGRWKPNCHRKPENEQPWGKKKPS